MSIGAVIFDMGGVLVRTEDRTPRQQLAARLGMTYSDLSALIFDSQSAVQATLGEITAEEHWRVIQNTLRMSDLELAQLRTEFWAGDRLDESLVNFLRALRPGRKTALLSNAWDDLRSMIEEDWQIEDAFDCLVISAEVGLAKPAPGIYQKAVAELGVVPSRSVFVDDFPQNVEGARAAGLRAIHFQSSKQALADLQIMFDGD